MATDLTGLTLTAAVSLSGAIQKALDLTTPQDSISVSKALAFAFGSGAAKADQIFHDRRTLAAGASEELDLAGPLVNPLGGTITFEKVKVIIVFNRSDEALGAHTATDAEVAVGGAAADEFLGPFQAAGDAIGIPAGGFFAVGCKNADGWAVVVDYTGNTDKLKVENLDGVDEALYDVILIGEAA
jgi:hypothetical protein